MFSLFKPLAASRRRGLPLPELRYGSSRISITPSRNPSRKLAQSR